MCMYLNKNNSRVRFSSLRMAQVQQESTGEYKCACIQAKVWKNLLSLKANRKVFKPSHINNKIVSETALNNANKKHAFQFKAIFSLFLQHCLRDYFVLPLYWHSLTFISVSPSVKAAQTQTKTEWDSTHGGNSVVWKKGHQKAKGRRWEHRKAIRTDIQCSIGWDCPAEKRGWTFHWNSWKGNRVKKLDVRHCGKKMKDWTRKL